MDRRTFLRNSGLMVGGLAFAGPLQAFAARVAYGQELTAKGYGPLIDMGDLLLPEGFTYRVISREGEPMSDGLPTPSRFDGMAVFEGPSRGPSRSCATTRTATVLPPLCRSRSPSMPAPPGTTPIPDSRAA